MADERDVENGRISNFWTPRDLDLDLGSGYMAYRRASINDPYLHTKFHSNWRNFVDGRTDGRTDVVTYVWTYGRTDIEAGFIRSTSYVDSEEYAKN